MDNLFTKSLGGSLFNFQPLNLGQTTGYHVDVKDEDGTRWEFRMISNEDNTYKLEGEKLPAWILQLKDDLQNVISEHE